ncbi:MAG: UvrD family DEAD/DEAH box helicase, partial [Bryobacterales bacterium]|nr:UvrD family DEAD/DEAH box helicase [Bryobacterales bacterium]
HQLKCLPPNIRGTALLAETTVGKLLQAIQSNLALKSKVRHPDKLLDRSLLWLHEQEVVRLNKGLAVFRPAMKIRLEHRERRGFSKADFTPLALHYEGQVLQVHVMAEFAARGLAAMSEALRLAMDYFTLDEEKFLERWLPGRGKELGRQTTPASWRAIVESLKNPDQQRIVADEREQANVLVLAGPGSGKTRVLVHRIAWLTRVPREDPKGIVALAYNRHAAVDIRRRLAELIGDDARRVTVLTCHALAMRLAGASFAARAERPSSEMFSDVLKQAIAVLRGEGLPPDEADERRAHLLAGFRWILVDEYQDIGPEQYDLISALAGRTLEDDAGKLTLFAVGDDDQNIYAFNRASVEFIRRFQADYGPSPKWLTTNYRSTANIVSAANTVIEASRKRMKAGKPMRVDRARAKDPPGGKWSELDPVSQGRVQILPAGGDPVHQARAVMAEILRLSSLAPGWDWARCAVLAREWDYLVPARAVCETHGIPTQMANEPLPNFWQLRQTRDFVQWLRGRKPEIVDDSALAGWLDARPSDRWHDLLRQAAGEHALESGGREAPVNHFIE